MTETETEAGAEPRTEAASAQATGGLPRVRTLAEAWRVFWRVPSPWILAGSLVLVAGARIAVGDVRWWHLLIAAAVVAVQPFTEWVLHVTVLHARPLRLSRWTFDSLVAREHRRHHGDPRNLRTAFIPTRVVFYLLLTVAAECALIPGWPARLTAATTMLALGCLYEWTHFLIHTDYKPRSAVYRLIYAKHRLHHYRNERYWFGVTSPVGDIVLRTNPRKDDVPVSPTCKTVLATRDQVDHPLLAGDQRVETVPRCTATAR